MVYNTSETYTYLDSFSSVARIFHHPSIHPSIHPSFRRKEEGRKKKEELDHRPTLMGLGQIDSYSRVYVIRVLLVRSHAVRREAPIMVAMPVYSSTCPRVNG